MHVSVENSLKWPLKDSFQGEVLLCNYRVSHSGCSSTCHYDVNIHRMKGTIMSRRKIKRRFVVFLCRLHSLQIKSWSESLKVFLLLSKDKNWKVIHKMEFLTSHLFLNFCLFMLRTKKETKNGWERWCKNLKWKQEKGEEKTSLLSLKIWFCNPLQFVWILSAAFNHLGFLIIFTRNFLIGEHQVFKQDSFPRLCSI